MNGRLGSLLHKKKGPFGSVGQGPLSAMISTTEGSKVRLALPLPADGMHGKEQEKRRNVPPRRILRNKQGTRGLALQKGRHAMTSIAKGSMRRLALTLPTDDCMERNDSPPRQTHHHQWKVRATTWQATYGNMLEEPHGWISLPTIQYSRFLRRHAGCR